MVHHSLTKDTGTVSWPAIEKYHREVNGWRDIGYHAGVEQTGEPAAFGRFAWQGLVGRPEHTNASACPQGNMNSVALHLCFVGNFDEVAPPLHALEVGVRRFLIPWMDEYGITPAHIVGHRDFNPAKTCPGLKFDLDLLRRMTA